MIAPAPSGSESAFSFSLPESALQTTPAKNQHAPTPGPAVSAASDISLTSHWTFNILGSNTCFAESQQTLGSSAARCPLHEYARLPVQWDPPDELLQQISRIAHDIEILLNSARFRPARRPPTAFHLWRCSSSGFQRVSPSSPAQFLTPVARTFS